MCDRATYYRGVCYKNVIIIIHQAWEVVNPILSADPNALHKDMSKMMYACNKTKFTNCKKQGRIQEFSVSGGCKYFLRWKVVACGCTHTVRYTVSAKIKHTQSGTLFLLKLREGHAMASPPPLIPALDILGTLSSSFQ